MKLILQMLCAAILLHDFAYGRFQLKHGEGFVGVSELHLEQYIYKAFRGFKKVMLEGDDELGYRIMDPYKLERASWNHIDTSGGKKYRLSLSITDTTIIKGLSDYMIGRVKTNVKDMRVSFTLVTMNMQIELPYKLDGSFIENLCPIYGEGTIKLSNPYQYIDVSLDLGDNNGKVNVEKVLSSRYALNTDVKVTGLMDLPNAFANLVVDDVLDSIVKEHGDIILSKLIHDLVEGAVGGMTIEELFEYVDYFVKKADNQK